MTDSTRFETKLVGPVPVVDVIGDVDISNVDELEAALAGAAERDVGVVVVSLQNASYFDSRTIHVLYRFADRLETNRQRMVIVAPSDSSAQRILKITGLAAAVEHCDNLDEALAKGAEAIERRTTGQYDA